MMSLRLHPRTRALLAAIAAHTTQAKELRRAQALLWLDQGESLPSVAQRLYVTRQTVVNWVHNFQERQTLPVRERLADGPRSGRPRRGQPRIDPLLRAGLSQDPWALGYRSTIWTASLLTQYLWDTEALRISPQRVRLALARLEVRWKRPRYRLAHRAATWRQAKGGSNGGCAPAHGRSSLCSMRPLLPRCLPSPMPMDAEGNKWRSRCRAHTPDASCTAR